MKSKLIISIVLSIQTVGYAQYYAPTPRPYSNNTANSTPRFIQQQPRFAPLPPPVYLPPAPQPQYRPAPTPYYNSNTANSTPQIHRPPQTYIPPPSYRPTTIYTPPPIYKPTPAPLVVQPVTRAPATSPPTPQFQRKDAVLQNPVQKQTTYAGPLLQQSTRLQTPVSASSMSHFPSNVRISLPISADEIWLIQHEGNWNVNFTPKPTPKNPHPTAFGLGQLIKDYREPYAAELSRQLGFYVDPKTTNPDLQLLMMKMYIARKYGTAAAAKAAWLENCKGPLGCYY